MLCTPHVLTSTQWAIIASQAYAPGLLLPTAIMFERQEHDRHLRRSIDGLSRKEASEVRVGSLSSNLQLALQVGDPALHEHPAPLLGVLVQYGLCWPLLTLQSTEQCQRDNAGLLDCSFCTSAAQVLM